MSSSTVLSRTGSCMLVGWCNFVARTQSLRLSILSYSLYSSSSASLPRRKNFVSFESPYLITTITVTRLLMDDICPGPLLSLSGMQAAICGMLMRTDDPQARGRFAHQLVLVHHRMNQADMRDEVSQNWNKILSDFSSLGDASESERLIEAKRIILAKPCRLPGCDSLKPTGSVCSGCHLACYCSSECQSG